MSGKHTTHADRLAQMADDQDDMGREDAAAALRAGAAALHAHEELVAALRDLWNWTDGEGCRLGEPVPDGLGAKVIAALAKAEGQS